MRLTKTLASREGEINNLGEREDPAHTSAVGNREETSNFGECEDPVHASEAGRYETKDLGETTEVRRVVGLGESARHRISEATKPRFGSKKLTSETK